MKTIWFLVFIVFGFAQKTTAQLNGDIWCFGEGTIFNTHTNGITNAPFRFGASTASISNGNQLMLYTDGFRVYNSQNQIIENGDSLAVSIFPAYSYNQNFNFSSWEFEGVTLLNYPGHVNQFVLISSRRLGSGISGWMDNAYGINYSVIDMNQNGGLGKVIQKNVQLLQDTVAQALGCIRHANGRDWWIFSCEPNTNKVYKLLLDPLGLHLDTVNIVTPTGYGCPTSSLTFDQSGNYFARVLESQDESILQIHTFDRCIGEFTLFKSISLGHLMNNTWGIAFSPNDLLIYLCIEQKILQVQYLIGIPIINEIFTIGSNPRNIASIKCTSSGQLVFGYYKSFPIYQTDSVPLFLGQILNPDSLYPICSVDTNAIYLNGSRSSTFLTNNPNFSLGASDGSACDTLGLNNIIEPNSHLGTSLYPNPSQGTFQFMDLDISNVKTINVLSMDGREIKSLSISDSQVISDLQSGYYLIQIKMLDGSNKILKLSICRL